MPVSSHPPGFCRRSASAVALIAVATIAGFGFEPAAFGLEIPPPGSPADVAAIRAAAAAYREALANGDAAAIRAAWTADGDIVDGWGNRLSAQDPAAVVGGPAEGPRPEFRLGESQIRFVAPDVAVEDGTVDAILPGMTNPIEGWFSAVWVRQEGGWKLTSLRESERPVSPIPTCLPTSTGWSATGSSASTPPISRPGRRWR